MLNITVYTSPAIYSLLPTLINSEEYEHLDGLELADGNYHDSHKPIDVLIGSDHYWSIVTGDTVVGFHGPVALSSKLGWLLSAPLDRHSVTVVTQSHLVLNGDFIDQPSSLESDALIIMLHRFWNTESIGIQRRKVIKQRLPFWRKCYSNRIDMKWVSHGRKTTSRYLITTQFV